ncbi:ricin-type beta-trefoil lectin domain protein [Lentzea sp. NPDC058436]|uniref:RICIN domain-containing protein n=1 Tax=Lentzea sp. NPDC058436 TaxID=3346499 RepID=UPI003663B3E7
MQKLKAALVMAACAAGALGASIPAAASDASVLSTVRHVQSGQCLDGSVSNGVVLKTCNSGAYQEWGTTGGDIVHAQSGQCLDGSVSNGVRLKPCNGSVYQQWTISGNQIKHVQSGLCLDGSVSNGVRLNTCNGSAYQKWTN